MRRSGFLTFLTSLIPGVGYMYLGLMKKGIQALVLFALIGPLLSALGLHGLVSIIRTPLWFYFLFDTYNLAHRIDRGDYIEDSEFIFEKYFNEGRQSYKDPNSAEYGNGAYSNGDRKKWTVIGWTIIVLGVLGLLNKILGDSSIYYAIKETIGNYLIPVLFILGGAFLLVKK